MHGPGFCASEASVQGRDCLARDGSWPGALHLSSGLPQAAQSMNETAKKRHDGIDSCCKRATFHHSSRFCKLPHAHRICANHWTRCSVQAVQASAGRLRGQHE